MGGLGAFLNAFGATTMEYQKRAQDQQKVQMELQIQQAQLAMNQMQFERTMQNRELVRQDALKQNQIENQIAEENLVREQRNTDSLISSREGETARKEAQLAANALTAESGATPAMEEMRFKAGEARKAGDEVNAKKYEARLAGMEEQANKAARRPSGAGLLTGGDGDAPSAAPADDTGADLGEGGTMAPQPQAQPMGGGAPAGGGSPSMGAPAPAAQPQAQPQGQAQPQMQQQRGQVKVTPLTSGKQEEEYETEAEAEARREELKKHNFKGRVVTSKTSKAKESMELNKARVDDLNNQGALLSSEQGKAEVQDILNRNGLQDVEFVAEPKGMKRSGYNINVGAGGLLASTIRGSVSSSGGESHAEMPKAAFVPKGPAARPEWMRQIPTVGEWMFKNEATVNPDFAENVATALANDALQTKNGKLEPQLADAGKDLVRNQVAVIRDLVGDEKTIILKPFDAFNRPERAFAAKLAQTSQRAEDQLAGVTEGYTRVGTPHVQDTPDLPLNQKLGLFKGAVTGETRDGKPLNTEQQGLALQELAAHLQPDLKDGSFSPGAKQEAMKAWEAVQQSNWDPQSKQGAYQILKPAIMSPTTKEGEKAAQKEQAKSETVPEAGGPPSMRGAVSLAALGTMGGQPKQGQKAPATPPKKAAPPPRTPSTPPKDTSVQNEMSSVKAAQDRPAAAKKAADNITSSWGRLSETERSTVRKQWASQRGLWKSYGVPEETLAKLDKLIGKEKSRADVVGDAAREIEALKKKKG